MHNIFRIKLGYEIESHWQDGSNGNWTSVDDRVIGTGKLDVHFYSKMSRGMSFTIKVYYVPSYEGRDLSKNPESLYK